MIGWRQLRGAQPNRSHQVLARLERAGRVQSLITQNVDGLHQRAGSLRVLDLHGRIDTVECLRCARSSPREQFQLRLEHLNPHWGEREAPMAPDGDALLEVDTSAFALVGCERCDGPLKPAVVFFGGAVPSERVARADGSARSADALLVVGSSLMAYSAYRLVRTAHERGLPIAIINRGRTRADALAAIKLDGQSGLILEGLEAIMAAVDAGHHATRLASDRETRS